MFEIMGQSQIYFGKGKCFGVKEKLSVSHKIESYKK